MKKCKHCGVEVFKVEDGVSNTGWKHKDPKYAPGWHCCSYAQEYVLGMKVDEITFDLAQAAEPEEERLEPEANPFDVRNPKVPEGYYELDGSICGKCRHPKAKHDEEWGCDVPGCTCEYQAEPEPMMSEPHAEEKLWLDFRLALEKQVSERLAADVLRLKRELAAANAKLERWERAFEEVCKK